MNHLMPLLKDPSKWKDLRGKSYVFRNDEKYRYVMMHDILVRMTQNRAVLPHFNYDRYSMWPLVSKKLRIWRRVIFEELYAEVLKGEVIFFPFLGRCYAGHFITDSGCHYVNAAFEFDENECALLRQDHYTWTTHYNLTSDLLKMWKENRLEHITNILPIGQHCHKDEVRRRLERKQERRKEREARVAAYEEKVAIEKEREAIRAELRRLRGETEQQ